MVDRRGVGCRRATVANPVEAKLFRINHRLGGQKGQRCLGVFHPPVWREAQRQMNRYQRLIEIYQHKGGSECVADAGAMDPSCTFEQIPLEQNGFPIPSITVRGTSVRYSLKMNRPTTRRTT